MEETNEPARKDGVLKKSGDHSSPGPKKEVSVIIPKSPKEPLEHSSVPNKLRLFISPKIWNSYSPIRQDSFRKIYESPNTFFYRNRPPGDPQKFGPFSAEEEAHFLKRLEYFRNELHIQDGLWGLFSVPIRGRLGYQCSNFYRLLVKEGKIKDNNYTFTEEGKLRYAHTKARPSDDAVQALEQEAFRFIAECFSDLDGSASFVDDSSPSPPRRAIPIRLQAEKHRKEKNERHEWKVMEKKIKIEKNQTEKMGKSDKQGKSTKLLEKLERLEKSEKSDKNQSKNDRHEKDSRKKSPKPAKNSPDNELDESIKRAWKRRQQAEDDMSSFDRDLAENEITNTRSTDDETSPLHYAPDPLTGIPMTYPMLDPPSGIVFDLSSWDMVFHQDINIPFKIYAQSVADLIPMNKKNFPTYMLDITNIFF